MTQARARSISLALVGIGLSLLALIAARPARQSPPRGTVGSAAAGFELIERFECAKCHDIHGVAADATGCVGCHRAVRRRGAAEAFQAPKIEPSRVRHFVDLPSLTATAQRFRRDWLREFLLRPHDLRPALDETMPRLEIDPQQAADLAAYLAPYEPSPGERLEGDVERGYRVFGESGCGVCHRFSGAELAVPSPLAVELEPQRLARALALAPDLRHTRQRFQPGALARFIQHPSRLEPDTLMPELGLDATEARDLAAYVWHAPLARLPSPSSPPRLPLLARPVTFAEVSQRVFGKACSHCHGGPESVVAKGGPGSGGGFGFPARRIDLTRYETTLAGHVNRLGQRRSLFAPVADGTPLLVAALRARHLEQSGQPVPGVRGMPLALPALPPEDIQLVESWIAQGRPE